jgi:hypothetical protein
MKIAVSGQNAMPFYSLVRLCPLPKLGVTQVDLGKFIGVSAEKDKNE